MAVSTRKGQALEANADDVAEGDYAYAVGAERQQRHHRWFKTPSTHGVLYSSPDGPSGAGPRQSGVFSGSFPGGPQSAQRLDVGPAGERLGWEPSWFDAAWVDVG